MRRTVALAWKEWRELRWFVFAGLVLFLAVPLMDAAHRAGYDRGFCSDAAAELAMMLGPLLAVLLGVGASCPDLRDELRQFWQSRPIGLTRWLLIKYAAGLLVVLAVCGLPLLMQLAMHAQVRESHWSGNIAFDTLTCHMFALILIYSVSFLLGCLVRRAAHAAILGFAAALLILFLPLVTPSLGWLSSYSLTTEQHHVRVLREPTGWRIPWSGRFVAFSPEYRSFVVTMLAGIVVSLGLARLAVGRDWRLRADQKLLCCTLGLVAVILFGVTAFQLGSNLPCERQIPLLPVGGLVGGGSVAAILSSGEQGVVVLHGGHPGGYSYSARRFDLSRPHDGLGPEVPIGATNWSGWAYGYPVNVAWVPEHPERAYFLMEEKAPEDEDQPGFQWEWQWKALALYTIAFDVPARDAVVHRLDLLPHLPDLPANSSIGMHRHKEAIYIRAGQKLLALDIANPNAPALSQVLETGSWGFFRRDASASKYDTGLTGLNMLPLTALGLRDRLEISLHLGGLNGVVGLEDDLVVVTTRQHLTTYRLKGFADNEALLERVGRRLATPLEKCFGHGQWGMALKDGVVYVLESGLHSGLTVYDVRVPERPRRVGHYAAPAERFRTIALLPGRRVLVGQRNLHIVATGPVLAN